VLVGGFGGTLACTSMNEQQASFWRQAGLVLLGAGIGFVPAYVNTSVQAQFQEERARRERKLTAVAEHSRAIMLPAADIIARSYAFERSLANHEAHPDQKKLMTDEMEQFGELVDAKNRWIAGLNAHGPILSALFGVKVPWRDFGVDTTTPAKQRDNESRARAQVGQMTVSQFHEQMIAEARDQRARISDLCRDLDSQARELVRGVN
jgi:hypothetical protein